MLSSASSRSADGTLFGSQASLTSICRLLLNIASIWRLLLDISLELSGRIPSGTGTDSFGAGQ